MGTQYNEGNTAQFASGIYGQSASCFRHFFSQYTKDYLKNAFIRKQIFPAAALAEPYGVALKLSRRRKRSPQSCRSTVTRAFSAWGSSLDSESRLEDCDTIHKML